MEGGGGGGGGGGTMGGGGGGGGGYDGISGKFRSFVIPLRKTQCNFFNVKAKLMAFNIQ